MAANKFICTGKGFVKGITFDKELLKEEVNYTHLLREAKSFSTSSADKFLKKHEIEGFAWNPYEHQSVGHMYEVKLCTHIKYDTGYTNRRELSKWEAVRVYMETKNDVHFLNTKGEIIKKTLFSLEEATELAAQKNKELVAYIIE